jgi:hypothetical protein
MVPSRSRTVPDAGGFVVRVGCLEPRISYVLEPGPSIGVWCILYGCNNPFALRTSARPSVMVGPGVTG